MGVRLNGQPESSCQAKVGKFDVAGCVDEQVLRLEVSVHHTMRVTEGRRLNDLVRELFDRLWRKRTTQFTHVLLQVIIAMFKDQP